MLANPVMNLDLDLISTWGSQHPAPLLVCSFPLGWLINGYLSGRNLGNVNCSTSNVTRVLFPGVAGSYPAQLWELMPPTLPLPGSSVGWNLFLSWTNCFGRCDLYTCTWCNFDLAELLPPSAAPQYVVAAGGWVVAGGWGMCSTAVALHYSSMWCWHILEAVWEPLHTPGLESPLPGRWVGLDGNTSSYCQFIGCI